MQNGSLIRRTQNFMSAIFSRMMFILEPRGHQHLFGAADHDQHKELS